MKDYFKRFGLMIGCVAGMIAFMGGIVWLASLALRVGGFWGGLAFVFVLACAIAAAMPDDYAPL